MKPSTSLKSVIRVVIFVLCLHGIAHGQISRGGVPIQVKKLKSLDADDWIILPKVDNLQLREASIAKQKQSLPKPFHFSKPF